jgi:hypothetical protein
LLIRARRIYHASLQGVQVSELVAKLRVSSFITVQFGKLKSSLLEVFPDGLSSYRFSLNPLRCLKIRNSKEEEQHGSPTVLFFPVYERQ